MKNLILFSLIFISAVAFGQTTETSFKRDSDSTFVETTTTTDAAGRTISQSFQYFSNAEFAQMAVSTASQAHIESEMAALRATHLTRDANQLRRFVIDSLSENFDSIRANILLQSLTNFSKLIERVGSTATPLDFSIAENPANPIALRLTVQGTPNRVGNVIPVHFEKFIIRNFYPNEDVEMVYRVDTDLWVGRNAAGTVLVLRR